MDRCDFCSILTCLKNHISESNQMSQPEFLYEIFADFMDSQELEDFSLDNGLVCRWMTGQAKISPKISSYYARPSRQELLAETKQINRHRKTPQRAGTIIYLLFRKRFTITGSFVIKQNCLLLYLKTVSYSPGIFNILEMDRIRLYHSSRNFY